MVLQWHLGDTFPSFVDSLRIGESSFHFEPAWHKGNQLGLYQHPQDTFCSFQQLQVCHGNSNEVWAPACQRLNNQFPASIWTRMMRPSMVTETSAKRRKVGKAKVRFHDLDTVGTISTLWMLSTWWYKRVVIEWVGKV